MKIGLQRLKKFENWFSTIGKVRRPFFMTIVLLKEGTMKFKKVENYTTTIVKEQRPCYDDRPTG